MDIVTIDRTDPGVVEQLWQLSRRSDAASRVTPHRYSLAEFDAELGYRFPGEHDEAAAALIDGRVAGWSRIWFPERDNTDKAWFEVTVDPAARGRGVGCALVEWAEQAARSQGRAMVLPEAIVPVGERADHPYARFADHLGYSVSDTEIVRRLLLPVDEQVLGRLEASAAEAMGTGYTVQVHANGVPDELRPSLCEVSNRLALDAPTGDIDFQAESMTPADYQHHLEHEARMGRSRLTAVALDRATGTVVAYSDLVLPQGDPDLVFQWGTLVMPGHRGHRLGMAVKVANLRELARVDPGRRHVETMNAEDNPWMVAINVDLGFEIVEEALMLRKDL